MKLESIFFDGYCPESLLEGHQVEMRLNCDDFWESEATGLQVAVFPPYATILRWRGKGRFRASSGIASDSLNGLVLAGASLEEGKEMFPDESRLLIDTFDLGEYLKEVYASREEYDKAKFNPQDPAFTAHAEHLARISKADLEQLISLYRQASEDLALHPDDLSSRAFSAFHKLIYDLKLVFSFDWMAWHAGWKNIHNKEFDYASCSRLELSMYLTAIFRADRFNEGTIATQFASGTIGKIMESLIRAFNMV